MLTVGVNPSSVILCKCSVIFFIRGMKQSKDVKKDTLIIQSGSTGVSTKAQSKLSLSA